MCGCGCCESLSNKIINKNTSTETRRLTAHCLTVTCGLAGMPWGGGGGRARPLLPSLPRVGRVGVARNTSYKNNKKELTSWCRGTCSHNVIKKSYRRCFYCHCHYSFRCRCCCCCYIRSCHFGLDSDGCVCVHGGGCGKFSPSKIINNNIYRVARKLLMYCILEDRSGPYYGPRSHGIATLGLECDVQFETGRQSVCGLQHRSWIIQEIKLV